MDEFCKYTLAFTFGIRFKGGGGVFASRMVENNVEINLPNLYTWYLAPPGRFYIAQFVGLVGTVISNGIFFVINSPPKL
jgi:hypothetical protein